jgi:hypothetical protein
MITLIEKIKKQLDTATPKLNRPIYQSKKIEKIADDYAIEFSEWCLDSKNKLGYHEIKKEWYNYNSDKWITTKELLEIFKKEKGL